MSRWWRAYSDARNDPKLMLLSPEMFRAWFILVCLAADNDGEIKSASDAAFALRVNGSKAQATVAFLAGKGLFDPIDGGYFEPHNWSGRQYKTDATDSTNAARQKRWRNAHRNAHRNGDRNGAPNDQIQNTDTEQNREKEYMDGRGATRPSMSEPFDEFWGAYPKRDGSNPKHPAKKKFIAAVKSGVEAEAIIAGARRYASELASKQIIGTPYVKQAVTWLNARMWEDQAHHPTGPPNGAAGWKPGLPTHEELLRKFQNGKAVEADTGKPVASVDEDSAQPRPGSPRLVHGRSGN